MRKNAAFLIASRFSSFLTAFYLTTTFAFGQVPSIGSFSPKNGPIGTEVIIKGFNFNTSPENNVVFFGGAKATVTTASSSELVVSVPSGATFQPISVLTNGLITYSESPFVVTFPGKALDKNAFENKVEFVTGENPSAVVQGDLDGDGKIDLIMVNVNGASLSILRNISTIENPMNFADAQMVTVGAVPYSVTLGDMNGDGLLDLVVANSNSNSVSVLRNITSSMGTINFAPKEDYVTGNEPSSVVVADFDGDGKSDVAVSSSNDLANTISIFRNISISPETLIFDQKSDFSTGLHDAPKSLIARDFDGDGKCDIAALTWSASGSKIVIMHNESEKENAIHFNLASSFATGLTNLTTAYSFSAGDLNSDGLIDLIVANRGDFLNFLNIHQNNTESNGTISFTPGESYSLDHKPESIALGDLDGDTKLDLAIVSYTDNTISLFKNLSVDGIISYEAKIDFATGQSPTSVCIGDINADGKADLAVSNSSGNSISVYKNIISPSSATDLLSLSFTDQIFSATIDMQNHLVEIEVAYAADITKLIPYFDLSYGATLAANNVQMHSGLSPLDFSNAVTLTVTAQDGSTTQDYIVSVTRANANVATNIITFNLAEQSRPAVINELYHTINIEVVFVTDLTSLIPAFELSPGATAEINGLVQISGTTANGFIDPVTYTIVAEDGITKQEWIVTVIVAGVPSTITSFSPSAGPIGTMVTISGSNFDAIVDNNTVYFGATQAEVANATSTSLVVSVPYGATYQPISVLTNGLSTFSSTPFDVTISGVGIDAYSFEAKLDFLDEADQNTSAFTYPYDLAMADIDDDGKSDLAVANYPGQSISIFRNKGASTGVDFENKIDFSTFTDPTSISIGDVDGDGKMDVVVSDFYGLVSVFRNISTPGNVSFDERVDFELESRPQSVSLGDLDGDGKLDVVVTSGFTFSVFVLRNTSAGVGAIDFSEKMEFPSGANPYTTSLGDLNGDEKLDMVVLNNSDNTVSIFENNSTRPGMINFNKKKDFSVINDPRSILLGDLNHDGYNDLIVYSVGSFVSVFTNTFSKTDSISFSDKADFYAGSLTKKVALGNVDGDGKADLVITTIENTVSVLANISPDNGNVAFSPAVGFDTGSAPLAVAIGDLDGDGKSEIIVNNYSGRSVSVFRNTIFSSNAEILSFTLAEQTGPGIIDNVINTIKINVLHGTNLATLIPNLTLSAGAKVSPESGIAVDFAASVTYTVTAENGTTTKEWEVTINIDAPALSTAEFFQKIVLYPNSVDNLLFLNLVSFKDQFLTITLSDVTGRSLEVIQITARDTHVINVEKFKSGIYLATVQNGNSTVSLRFIKN
jgi:trimeric autotransporter adhesin